jgi:hypothetical protein
MTKEVTQYSDSLDVVVRGSTETTSARPRTQEERSVTHSVAELIDMARALSEGDFDKQLDQDFNGELGQLASYLDAVRQTLQSLAAATTGSKDLLPKAADGVADINREAESGFNSVWEVVEEMQSNQAEIRSLLEACAVELKGSGATELQTILAKNRANLLALMSYLSFQDVLRQRLEKVQCIISMIEEKLLQLSVKFNLRSSEKLVREGDGAGLELAARLDQVLVDQLLARLR